jgi:23S rRNA (adenine2503-C2)-methyltransferase
MKQQDIREISLPDLTEFLRSRGQPAFRAKQIHAWLWQRNARSFDEMTNLPISLRQELNEDFTFRNIFPDKLQISEDGTIKARFRLHDGFLIESVLIPVVEENRFTACVSSQVGCSLTCSFCATGKMKRERNLSSGEIVAQVNAINNLCLEHFNKQVTNIVYMGMGEPLLAYHPVMDSIEKLTSPLGWNMAPKRITISTAGIGKMIRQLADDGTKTNLALSLHAADDEKRNQIMPINESNNLKTLMDSISYYYQKTGNRISYEYIAFQGFNDSLADANNLLNLCRNFPVRINIIEYNPILNAPFEKSSANKTDIFAKTIREKGIMVTVRRSRGKDIDAACGQLANRE